MNMHTRQVPGGSEGGTPAHQNENYEEARRTLPQQKVPPESALGPNL